MMPREIADGRLRRCPGTRDERILANTQLVKPVRADALRFLIHFVGDLHQPLHCADNDDRGGNEV